MMNLVTRVKFAGCNSMIVRRFFSARASSTRKSHYETLNVTANASKKEIRDAYIQKSKLYHPDNDPSDPSLHEKFVAIQEAYDVLSSDQKRREYDIPGTNFYQGTVHRTAQNPRPGPEQYEQYEEKKANSFRTFHYLYAGYVPIFLFGGFWLSVGLYAVYAYYNSYITRPYEPPKSLMDDKTKKERKERLIESLERLKETQDEERKQLPKGKHDDWIFDTRIMNKILSPDGKGK